MPSDMLTSSSPKIIGKAIATDPRNMWDDQVINPCTDSIDKEEVVMGIASKLAVTIEIRIR